VLAYLRRLAPEYAITLISFEKSAHPDHELRAELCELGIEWRRLRYHKRPPVLSTLLDVLRGRRELIRATKQTGPPAILHVRSYVPALMASLARPRIGGKLLFDIRGFWVDERVEGGIWPAGGVLYRVAKRCERRFFAEADAIVTLTHASVPQIEAWTGGRPVPIEVIPTCVELERFEERPTRPDGPHVVWCGSIGTWYRFELSWRVAAACGMPLTVISREAEEAHRLLNGFPATISAVESRDVPQQLHAGDVGLCLIAASFSKLASTPTRFAEYLACGMPVVVMPGTGDLEALVQRHRVGAVLRSEDEDALATTAAAIRTLKEDPDLTDRCRRLARDRFDVQAGSAAYAALYRRLLV